jgi:S1-C subfamily serine protease
VANGRSSRSSFLTGVLVGALAAFIAAAVWTGIEKQGAIVPRARQASGSVALVWFQDESGFTSTGTAFAVDDRGHFLTCAHVVEGRSDVTLAIPSPGGERNIGARVKARDLRLDAALLEAAGAGLRSVRLGKAAGLEPGEEVLFAGFPLGYTVSADLLPSVSVGHISSLPLWRVSEGGPRIPIIQVDAIVSLGNSGSPLVRTSSGEVIGMMKSHIHVPGLSGSEEGVLDIVESIPPELLGRAGIGIALPADSLRAFLARNGVKT